MGRSPHLGQQGEPFAALALKITKESQGNTAEQHTNQVVCEQCLRKLGRARCISVLQKEESPSVSNVEPYNPRLEKVL